MTHLTEPQLWALRKIKEGYGGSPSALGQAMMDRPGALNHGRTLKAQGYGRLGGAMMSRLSKKGLVQLTYRSSGMWHLTRATLTKSGEDALL